MDGGRFLACYLVALIFLNTAYFFLNRRLSKGPFRVLLILSPLMLLFVVLMLLSMKP